MFFVFADAEVLTLLVFCICRWKPKTGRGDDGKIDNFMMIDMSENFNKVNMKNGCENGNVDDYYEQVGRYNYTG